MTKRSVNRFQQGFLFEQDAKFQYHIQKNNRSYFPQDIQTVDIVFATDSYHTRPSTLVRSYQNPLSDNFPPSFCIGGQLRDIQEVDWCQALHYFSIEEPLGWVRICSTSSRLFVVYNANLKFVILSFQSSEIRYLFFQCSNPII